MFCRVCVTPENFSYFLKSWKSKNLVFWNSDHSLFFVRSYLCWSSPTCQRVWGEPSEHGLCCRWVSGLRTPDRKCFSGKSKIEKYFREIQTCNVRILISLYFINIYNVMASNVRRSYSLNLKCENKEVGLIKGNN